MPIISVVQGDLLERFRWGEYWGIGHGCNTKANMGRGIAAQVKEEFPLAFREDQMCGYRRLGNMSFHQTQYGVIYNLYTQVYPGRPQYKGDSSFHRLRAIRDCFQKLEVLSCQEDFKKLFGIPMIGAGLAGGDWDKIVEAIEEATPNMKIELVEWRK